MHLLFLAIFLIFKWTDAGSKMSLPQLLKEVRLLPLSSFFSDICSKDKKISQYKSLLIIFTTNLIGMCFSRGTHQQFYSWYSYSFPFLADAAFENQPLSQFAICLSLEIAWSVAKPRSPLQSHLLNFSHFLIIFGLL
jgi:hypothetical protein